MPQMNLFRSLCPGSGLSAAGEVALTVRRRLWHLPMLQPTAKRPSSL